MAILGIGSRSALSMQPIADIRRQLDDLQRQLGTGRKADTYAGLGLNRGFAIGLNSQLSALAGFSSSIEQVSTRLVVAQTTLGQLGELGRTVKNDAINSGFDVDGTGRTTDQRAARDYLDVMIGLLNTRVGDRYLFSGKSSDEMPVESLDNILDGQGARAGLRQMISERRQADLGASGLGRLDIPASVGTTLSIAEDVAGSPFGFKLAAATTTMAGATVTGPAGVPPAVSVDLGATNPAAGDTIKLTFTLPDGTTTDLTLTATTSTTPGPNEFSIGVDSTATAANLQAALTTAVARLAGTELAAASAMTAATAFFDADMNNPPQRVNGPPFDSATSLVAGTAANSVIWYTGEAGADPARSNAGVRIDQSISVSYGMRANEEALRLTMQNVAVFAAVSFSPSDPNAARSYDALKMRVSAGLDDEPGRQKIADIEAELANAQTAMATASERHRQSKATLTDLLEDIRSVHPEEVGAQILALQTNLQASLQTTAMLLRISLINYL